MPFTVTRVRDALAPFDISVDGRLTTQISRYVDILLFWNQKVSLTSVTSPDDILTRHFGESMFGARLIEPMDETLVDVGSGAGFPGLALKLVCPGLRVLLVESVIKKAVFLSEVVRALDLKNVDVVRSRIEGFGGEEPDVVTARAVGEGELILGWAREHLSRRGRIILWLGAEDAASLAKNDRWNWGEQLLIPTSKNRVILQGSPVR